ncbi:beta-lactamase/transpeptidase-like protein [Suhomyces tanzawaensis NRRL Y-17324]|uniref:Beta-lactamase/transpeptidase-like protein n=1 Tax=Suhomyces tanzawaensis NRRL Y-17324 TaxID=984487 RepID=A0A1E4SRF2_9ASCO|nr:beta-lactamase/transpeptidase-like protein [Suhomyces tanzawaensis NRRL Y-17324]ODV82089.1 beta-lactamase/transpeptidase-like protein [Suhomyces tanzawaensis NRRL Y-17324]
MVFTPSPQLIEQLQEIVGELTTPDEGEKYGAIPAAIVGLTNSDKTVFLNGGGVRSIKDEESVQLEDQMSLYSCTKSMTALAALKLYEDGKLKLDEPASTYLPLVEHIGLIDPGTVNKQGEFTQQPRKPKSPVKVRDLFLHTSGLSYNFLSKDYYYLSKKDKGETMLNPSEKYFTNDKIPLIYEPGSKWLYGHSTDVLGLVVSYVAGKPLGEYLKEVLFDPIGMTSTTFHLKSTDNVLKPHFRRKDLSIIASSASLNLDPKLDMGGQGAIGTVSDYLRFLRVWLNYGYSPDTNTRVLKEETVKFAVKNHLPPGVKVAFDIPKAPKIDDGFSLTGNAVNERPMFTGRPAGSLYWGGLANLYYWIDLENGIAGFWASQILPPADPITASTYFRWEASVYSEIKSLKKKGKL